MPVLILQFFIVLFVAPAPTPLLASHIAAVAAEVFVFSIVKSFVVPPIEFEPSINTYLAAFYLNIEDVDDPEIEAVIPVFGFMVTVFTALAPVI